MFLAWLNFVVNEIFDCRPVPIVKNAISISNALVTFWFPWYFSNSHEMCKRLHDSTAFFIRPSAFLRNWKQYNKKGNRANRLQFQLHEPPMASSPFRSRLNITPHSPHSVHITCINQVFTLSWSVVASFWLQRYKLSILTTLDYIEIISTCLITFGQHLKLYVWSQNQVSTWN